MQGDLNRFIGKKTASGKNQQPKSQGQFYTLLSCAKSRDKVLLLNFEPADIKVNESALEEMVKMRKESLFSQQQALIELNSISMSLFSVRSWNGHLKHCHPSKHVDEILDDWKDIQKNTQHGLTLCYNIS